jgi:hypothetical protein
VKNGPNGPCRTTGRLPIITARLVEHGFHRIDDDLTEDWLDAFVAEGLVDVESYLRKHADFQSFLEDRD